MRVTAAHVQIVNKGGRTYHYARVPTDHGHMRVRLSDNYQEALHECASLKSEGAFAESYKDYLPRLLARAKQRSSEKRRPFELNLPALISLLDKQDHRCAVCFVRFSMRMTPGTEDKFCRPFAPSIDRIDSAGGYTLDNVRLVARIINFSINKWGSDAFLTVAAALAKGPKNEQGLQTILAPCK